jgi:hypothetical protein
LDPRLKYLLQISNLIRHSLIIALKGSICDKSCTRVNLRGVVLQ